ncbi:hypothetical protein C0J52_19864 [Blattella germanica]|nr:hypothetical protein C0J52_19864 [Blattella germanica]
MKGVIYLYLLCLLPIISQTYQWKNACPSKCICTEVVTNCASTGMTSIQPLHPSSQIYHFENNRIMRIKTGTFFKNYYKEMTELHLQNNLIRIIEPQFFQKDNNIKLINMSINNIQYIPPNTFDNLLKLRVLDLRGNRIPNCETFQKRLPHVEVFCDNYLKTTVNQNNIPEPKSQKPSDSSTLASAAIRTTNSEQTVQSYSSSLATQIFNSTEVDGITPIQTMNNPEIYNITPSTFREPSLETSDTTISTVELSFAFMETKEVNDATVTINKDNITTLEIITSGNYSQCVTILVGIKNFVIGITIPEFVGIIFIALIIIVIFWNRQKLENLYYLYIQNRMNNRPILGEGPEARSLLHSLGNVSTTNNISNG